MIKRYSVNAVIFDLDGVLVDSMPAVRAYWVDWARRRGVAPEAVLAALHLTAEELVRKFAPGLDAVSEAMVTADGQARIGSGITAFAGGRELIDALPRRSWAVVTSGRRRLALGHLAMGNLPVPDVLITGEDTPRGKPDPAGYLLAASRLGLRPDQCLAIEDSVAGVRAARGAGMTVIAVTNSHPASELTEASAVITSLFEVHLTVDPHDSPPVVLVALERKTPVISEGVRSVSNARVIIRRSEGKLRGVIFDMDGVLVLSEPFIAAAAIAMFAEKGFTVQPGEFRPYVGAGEDRFIGGVAEARGIPLEPARDKARTYAIYREQIRGRLQPLPGVPAFVRTCQARGFKLAVASGSDTVKVEANLREIALAPTEFATIVTGNEVERKKPAPDIFLEACARLALDPGACLVIEDAVNGVRAAKAAGARCLALTTSFAAADLRDADWIAADLAHVPLEALDW